MNEHRLPRGFLAAFPSSLCVVRNNGIVIDAVAGFQQAAVFAVADFHSALHHHDELFAFVRGEHKVAVVGGCHVDDEGFHVAVGLRLGERMIDHVAAALYGVVGEADAALRRLCGILRGRFSS